MKLRCECNGLERSNFAFSEFGSFVGATRFVRLAQTVGGSKHLLVRSVAPAFRGDCANTRS